MDRLPGPAWAFYLVLAVAVVLAETAIQWREGGFPIGTFSLLQVWNVGNFAFLLGLMHYLDKTAASALASFRPLLTAAKGGHGPSVADQSKFATLSYQLTTLPPRPALVATMGGAVFAAVLAGVAIANGMVPTPTPFADTARTTLSTGSVMTVFILANALAFLFFYHTVHQLAHVSRIYTKHARINVYQLQPLYALSRPGAFTALGLIAFNYAWLAVSAPAGRSPAPIEIGLSLTSAAIAGAAFALPLLGAHRRLVAEKDARLAEANARFEVATIELHRQLDSGRLVQMDHLNKALANLEIEQNALKKIPTWPWQPGAVRGLLAAIMLP
ncbi:MAG: hypothetical protein ACRDG5_08190, partial [Anaerolineales bacterium]